MEIPREPRKSKGIDFTPLIDVVFLLVIFFMLSTSFVVSESMELNIPSQGEESALASDVWVLRVNAQGTIDSEGTKLSLSELTDRVRGRLRADAAQKILVLAATETTVQQLVSVLDLIYLAGGRQVQVDKDKGA